MHFHQTTLLTRCKRTALQEHVTKSKVCHLLWVSKSPSNSLSQYNYTCIVSAVVLTLSRFMASCICWSRCADDRASSWTSVRRSSFSRSCCCSRLIPSSSTSSMFTVGNLRLQTTETFIIRQLYDRMDEDEYESDTARLVESNNMPRFHCHFYRTSRFFYFVLAEIYQCRF